jgi:3'-phosphoadenosine 5'-phosphosulfate sulfotransferase (PAPS reductase)/FAD synthetase
MYTGCALKKTHPQHLTIAPSGKEKLDAIFSEAKKKKRQYDALVPLSGGKDSVYILYLAKKVYNLNVLTYTFDNGFLSMGAQENIRNAVNAVKVDHVMVSPEWDLLKNLYKTALLESGDLCSVCGLGITMNFYRLSIEKRIPLILRGKSVIEENSYSLESIYDTKRFRKLMRNCTCIEKKDVNKFLIYPTFNLTKRIVWTLSGKMGKLISPLYYLDQKSESEIKSIIEKEMGWKDFSQSVTSKHFDCIASPLSNYIREMRFGYSRKVCHLSNMIRMGQISRDDAIEAIEREEKEEIQKKKSKIH